VRAGLHRRHHPDKEVPYHLNHRILLAHRSELDCGRVIMTHLSADMLARLNETDFEAGFEAAHDGMTVSL
jgi:hypothetical protein